MHEIENIERLFKEHYSELFSLAFYMLKDEEEARDIVHDVFAIQLAPENGIAAGKGYLIRSVRNRCLNKLREMSIREKASRLIRLDADLPEDTVQLMEREEYLSTMHDIICNELPPQCSRAMRLRFEDGFSYQEIAQEMQISKAAVYKHLRFGIEYIRKKLK